MTMTAQKILVIDDDPAMIEFCQQALGAEGFEVKGALSGEEGLQLLQEEDFDLTLLDVRLSDRDGLEVLSTIQEINPETPVVIITGHGTMQVAIGALKSGAQDFLLKPFTLWELLTSVQKVLRKHRDHLEELVEERTAELKTINEQLQREIIERKRAEEALAHERDLLYALMDSIPDKIYFKDIASHFTRINRAQAQILGAKDPTEAIGKTDFDFFTAELARDTYADEQQIVRSGQPLIDKLEKVTLADGQICWVSTTKAPIVDKEGQVTGIVGISRDITERRRMEEELRRRNKDLTALNAIATTIGQSLDLDDILNATLDKVLEVIDLEVGGIALLEEQSNELVFVAIRGFHLDTSSQQERPRLRLGEGLFGRAAQSGETIFSDNISQDLGATPLAVNQEGLRAFVCNPLKTRNQVIGMMCVGSRDRRQFTAEDIQLLDSIGRQIAIAVENAHLFHMEREKGREAAALLDIARATSSTLALDELLDIVVGRAADLSGADRSSLWLLSPDGEHLLPAALFGMAPEFVTGWKKQLLKAEDELLSREAISTARPVVILDARTDPRTNKGAVGFFDDKSILVVPLLSKGHILGTLFLNHVRDWHPFSPKEVEMAMALAAQAATAIENARLYEEAKTSLVRAMESERRYRELIEGANDAIVNVDLEGRFILFNEKAEDIFGYQREEVLGKPFTIFIQPEDQKKMQRWFRLFLAGQTANFPGADTYQVEIVDRAGQLVPVELTISRIEKDKETPIVQVIARDIRERKRLEEERNQLLLNSQRMSEKLRNSFHQIGMALASSLDLDDTLNLIVNLAAEILEAEMCFLWLLSEEATEAEITANSALLTVRAARGMDETTMSALQLKVGQGLTGQVFSSGQTIHVVDAQLEPNLAYPDIAATEGLRTYLGVPLLIRDQVIGVLSLCKRQVFPFSEAEVELLSSFAHQASIAIERAHLFKAIFREKKELEAIIQNSADGILIMDRERHIVEVNPALEQLIGWRREELVGVLCRDILGSYNIDGLSSCDSNCPFNVVSPETDSFFAEHTITTRSGQKLDIWASYGLIRDEEGRVSHAIAILRDISKQKELDRMRSDLVSTASHELRTPLALIKGYIATLRRPDISLDNEREQRFLANIDQAVDRLARLIDDLLSASRIEAGRLELRLQLIDLGQIVLDVLDRLKPQAGNCQLVAELNYEERAVQADPDRIEQVLFNLLGNALKFSPDGGVVTVQVKNLDNPASVLISVKDQGKGIPPQEIDRIFEKFYRVQDGLVKKTSGVGLGLYICKSIVEAHGGHIWVESTPGQGSTFNFTLPS